MSGTPSLKLLLDLYQKCKARGEWASLFLVTKDGKDLVTFTKDAPNKKDSSDSLSALKRIYRRKHMQQNDFNFLEKM